MDYQNTPEAQGLRKLNKTDNNFRYHRPGEAVERKHEEVRAMLGAVAARLDEILPSGREASLVQTKLEEAMFWANAAVARNQ